MSGRSCKYGVLALGVRARGGECGAVAGETPPHLDARATNPGNSLDTRGGMPKKRGSAPPPARSSLAVSPGTSFGPRPRASCCRHAPLPASGGACARACLARPLHGLQQAAAGRRSCRGSSGQRCAGVEASGPSAMQRLAWQTCSPGGGIVNSQLHARIALGPCRSTGGGKSGGSRWSSGSPTVASATSERPRPSGLQVGSLVGRCTAGVVCVPRLGPPPEARGEWQGGGRPWPGRAGAPLSPRPVPKANVARYRRRSGG
jgi:hypothetical protein